MIQRIRSVILAGFVAGLATAAQAQNNFCAPFSVASAVGEVNAAAPGNEDRARLQDGLRAVLGDENRLLRDDIVGPVTVASLNDLCVMIPQVSGTDPVSGTVDLAVNYGRLAGFNEDWRLGLDQATLLSSDGGGSWNRKIVRLAAGAPMSAAALAGTAIGDNAVCASLATQPPDLTGSDLFMVQTALAALMIADPTLSTSDEMVSETTFGPATQKAAQDICLLYPVSGGVDGLLRSLRQISSIIALRPDALAVLGGADFTGYLGDDFVPKTIRLLGTAPAVVQLLSQYDNPASDLAAKTAEGTPTPGATDPAADACPRPPGYVDIEYFSLSADEVEGLKARSDVGAALQPLQEKKFANLQDLVTAVSTTLGVGAGSCAEFRLQSIFKARKAETEIFSLDSQKTTDLKIQPALSAVVPVLEDLVDVQAGSKESLTDGVKAQVSEAAQASEREKIEAAAAITAAAAVEEAPQPDAAAEGFPTGEASEPEPEFLLTDESITMIAAQIVDPEFIEAIKNTPTYAVSSREMVSTLALEQLAPIAETRATQATEETMKQIDDAGVIVLQYQLPSSIINDLKQQPEFAAVSITPQERLDELSGITYPFERLLNVATDKLPVNTATLSAGETEADLLLANERAVSGAARKFVDADSRVVAPFAADCGCSAPRPPSSLVYGFYPFWLADTESRSADSEEVPEEEAVSDTKAADVEPKVELIDFELFGRVAYDGLVIGEDGEIQNRRFWDAAGGNFVVSAHKYQSKADVAIRLRDWRSWNDDKIDEVIDNISEVLKAQPNPVKTESSWVLGRALDRLYSRKPDGVTLVVESYRDVIVDVQRSGGSGKSYQLGNLIKLVKGLHSSINDTNTHINLAFDIDLSEDDPNAANLFQDLEVANILRGSYGAKVNNVLVFLERDTTDTKKVLRDRIERAFSGYARIQVLRSVLPVVPPGGHEKIYGQKESGVAFSQFKDDVFYFQDNFGGMGFWPVLSYDQAVEADPKPDVRSIVMDQFSEEGQAKAEGDEDPVALGYLGKRYVAASVWTDQKLEPVCGWSCPRRLLGYFFMVVIAVSIAVLTWLMLYSSFWNLWGNRLYLMPIQVLLLLALLLLTQACDNPPLNWAIGGFIVVLAIVLFAQIYARYQTRLDGPLP